jgi:hypothetical protein
MTDIEKVKLKIGAVVSATFSDAQIQAFLDMEGSVSLAAAGALEAWATGQLGKKSSESIGSGDYSYSQKSIDDALALAKRLRDNDTNAPAFDTASMDLTNGSGITAEDD